MNLQTKKGILFAVIAACISGFSIFYNRLIIVKGIDPLIFNIVKNGGTAIILSILLFSLPQRKNLFNLPGKTWVKLFFIGLIGGSIPFILFFEGLKTTSAINANLIQKSLFVWVTLAAIPLLAEKLSRWQLVGFFLVFVSNFFLGGFSGFKFNQGEFLILLATLFWTVEIIMTKIILRGTHNLIVSWGRMFLGSLVLIFSAALWGKLPLLAQVKTDQILAVSGSVLLLTGYVTCFFKALKHAPANIVTGVLILATPITNVLSAIFITHSLPQMHLLNFVGTVLGIILITLFIRSPKKNLATIPTN